MSSFMSLDSPFYKFMSRLLDMLKLNVLWLVCSGVAEKFVLEYLLLFFNMGAYRILSWIPLIFIGPATTAAFAITLRMVDEQEGYISKPYFTAFRENLKKSMIIGVIALIAVYAIMLDFQFYHAAESLHRSSIGYLIIGFIAIYMAFMHLIYAFALQARYENTVINTLRNSYSILAKFFPRTIFLFIILAIEVAVIVWNHTTIFLGIIIGPGCIMLTISGFAMHAFRTIENENASGDDAEDASDDEV